MSRIVAYLKETTELLLERQLLARDASTNRRSVRQALRRSRELTNLQTRDTDAANLHQAAAEEAERFADFERWVANAMADEASGERDGARMLAEEMVNPDDIHRSDDLFESAQLLRESARDHERTRLEYLDTAAQEAQAAKSLFESAEEHSKGVDEALKDAEYYGDFDNRAKYITERSHAIIHYLQECGCPIIPEVPDFDVMVTESRTPHDDYLDQLEDDAEQGLPGPGSWQNLFCLPHLTPSQRNFLASEILTSTHAAIASKAALSTKEALWGLNPSAETVAMWEAYPELDNETLYECQLRKKFDDAVAEDHAARAATAAGNVGWN